ncbi:MAG: DUF11 domain-containing protein, partial [Anaerolineales bacterium]|nr:DUF11 domain-containing protein [Anaerolineales bacterium]
VDVTPTVAYGADHIGRSNLLDGLLPLNYGNIKNQGDGLLPTAHSQVYLWHDQGWAAALTTAGADWRTVFWGVPVSALTGEDTRQLALTDALGWLSDLGDSTFTVDARSGAVGDARTYTLTLRNWSDAPANEVVITNTLPPGLSLVPGSLQGGAAYDPVNRQVRWAGVIPGGGSRQITYQAVPDALLPPGTRLDNIVTIAYGRHHLQFDKAATLWLNAPDLRASELWGTAATTFPTRTITYTLRLQNQGMITAKEITAVLRLPDSFTPLTSTLSSSAGSVSIVDQRVYWQGDVLVGTAVTISLQVTMTVQTPRWWFAATAVIDDGITAPIVRSQILQLPPYTMYLPFIAKQP